MTDYCDKCGEYKKVRKNWQDLKIVHSPDPIYGIDYDWICGDCDKARAIRMKGVEIKKELEKKEAQKLWKEERNKLLELESKTKGRKKLK